MSLSVTPSLLHPLSACPPSSFPMSNLEAAHQLRLQQLLASGRLTPASSPTPESEAQAAAPTATATVGRTRRDRKKRNASKMNLTAVAESTPQYLPDAMNYIVCVSSRSPDVLLENDHSLHWYAPPCQTIRHTTATRTAVTGTNGTPAITPSPCARTVWAGRLAPCMRTVASTIVPSR